MKLILHNYRRCPYCMRVRIVLALKKLPHEIIEERMRDWTVWMVTHVPDPRVPILRVVGDDSHEKILRESHTINLWLDQNFGTLQFTPPEDSSAYAEMQQWVAWCDGDFKRALDAYKYGKDHIFDHKQHPHNIAVLRIFLTELEHVLGRQHYLLAQQLTLADIAIIPFIRQIMRTREGEFDFADFPHVRTWTHDMIDAPWFVDDVMKKHDFAKKI